VSAPTLVLRPGREKSLQHGHPWLFSRAVDATMGNPEPGDIVDVIQADGRFVARGYWNPQSQIIFRMLTRNDEPIDDDWWHTRIQQAFARRQHLLAHDEPRACRLINAENDFVPGLIADLYDRTVVLQALTLGIDLRKGRLAEILQQVTGAESVFERSDVDIRQKEGLGKVTGALVGPTPPERILFTEAHGVRLWANVLHGHKTGAYLDQAANRALIVDLLHHLGGGSPLRVLNLFCYTGGFSAHAAKIPGVHIVNVDGSRAALDMTAENMHLNGTSDEQYELVRGDVFELLRELIAARELFDLIVCDPPKFASSAEQLQRAARGYKDLNLHAFRLLKPGGLLMTFSCSGAVTADMFQKYVYAGLIDSLRQGQIIRTMSAHEDHPVSLTYPEGAYLKGLVVRTL